jgi:hypothetical protein
VREQTAAPVPQVHDYTVDYAVDYTSPSDFEWIMMERVVGRPLRERWHEISWLKKQLLVQQVVHTIAQLNQQELPSIGSLYSSDEPSSSYPDCANPDPSKHYHIGEAVQPPFFMGDHIQLFIYRGPFASSNSLVTAHM